MNISGSPDSLDTGTTYPGPEHRRTRSLDPIFLEISDL